MLNGASLNRIDQVWVKCVGGGMVVCCLCVCLCMCCLLVMYMNMGVAK